MLSITGMSSRLALTLLDKTEARQLADIRNEPANARAIARFRKEAGSITTAKDFVNNYDVYSFVMQAYDLKSQMFGKAMIQKILESDPASSTSLLNKLTDPRFGALFKGMGFTEAGTANANTGSASWQDQMVQKFVRQKYVSGEGDQNPTIGAVMAFRDQAANVKTWYDVLKDKKLGQFMRTVLNIPDGVISQDLTRQVALFKQKYDISKLQNPAEITRLVNKYVAISDAQNSQQNAALNPVVGLISDAASFNGSGQYVPATIDIATVLGSSNPYR